MSRGPPGVGSAVRGPVNCRCDGHSLDGFCACRLKGTKPASSRYLGNTKGDLSREKARTAFPIDPFDDLLSHKSGRIGPHRFRGRPAFFPVSPERRARERAAKARIDSGFVSTAVVGQLEVRKCWILRARYWSVIAKTGQNPSVHRATATSGCCRRVLSDGGKAGQKTAPRGVSAPRVLRVIGTSRATARALAVAVYDGNRHDRRSR